MINRTLEQRLARAAEVWKWQAVIKSTALVISFALLAMIAIGLLVQIEWVNTYVAALLLLVLALMISGVTWIVLLIRVADRRLDRGWLAAAVEQDQEQLMDRFNTVVELEDRPDDISAAMYREAIERQASILLRKNPRKSTFSWSATRMHLATTVLLLLLTILFYRHYQPLQWLANHAPVAVSSETGESPLSIPELPTAVSLSADAAIDPWGEIRISQPGRNLRITRHEEIPLLIEAAADRPLANVFWSTSVSIDDETKHELPEFEDPRYAVFQPVLKPEDLGLEDWGLVLYRAVALAQDETQYESATYFVEIVPSRTQLDALPEKAYEQLEQMTELIQRQQAAINQTDQLSDPGRPQQTRQMESLAEQENHIAESAERFQIALQSQLPVQVTQPFATSIDSARTALAEAETALREHSSPAASEPERTALFRLADARRQLADLVRDHPQAFQPSTMDQSETLQQRLAENRKENRAIEEQLEQMQQRDEDLGSAREFVQQARLKERAIQRDAYRNRQSMKNYPSLARQQLELDQQLQDAMNQSPEPFERAADESQDARSAMRQTAQSLNSEDDNAPKLADDAAKQLEKIDDAFEKQQRQSEIADQQAVREMLDQLNERLSEIAKDPSDATSQQKQETASQCKSVAAKACEMGGQSGNSPGGSAQSQSPTEPTSSGRPPLEQPGDGSGQQGSDSGSPQQQIEDASQRLATADGDQETTSSAQDLQQHLQDLAEQLGFQQPGGQQPGAPKLAAQQPGGKSGQAASGSSGQGDSLRPSGSEAIERGFAQLETATRGGQQGMLTAQARQELKRGGIADVVAGVQSEFGSSDSTRAVVRRLSEQVADPTSQVDMRILQSLREQIQSLQQDLTIQAEPRGDAEPTSRVDPSDFPPQYRDSIQKYFQTLSENP